MPQLRYEFVGTGHGELLDMIKSVGRAATQEVASIKAAAGRARAGAGTGAGRGVGPASAGQGYKADPQMDAYWKAQVKAAEQQGRAMQREHAKQYAEKARHEAKMRALEAKQTREAQREETAKARRLDKMNRDMEARYERQQKVAARAQARMGRGGGADSGGGIGAGALAMAGGQAIYAVAGRVLDTVMSAAREAVALSENTNRLSINARQAGQDFVSPTALRKDIQRAALETPGQSANDIANALQSFVSLTGELGTGRRSAKTFATVASATGANVGDVASAAASIFNQFGLKTEKEMQDVLGSLTFQGKQGAFELRDAASQFQRLAAAGASFGLTGTQGVKTIGGLAQIARTGTGSAEQTTTAIENIFSNLIAKSAILKQQGVDVFDKSGKTKDVTDILIDSIAKAGKGDFEKKGQILQSVFGDQGIRGVRPLMAKYQKEYQAVRGAGGSEEAATAAGVKRLREEIDKAVNAPGSWAEVQEDAAQAQKDMSAQVAYQWQRVVAIASEKVIPTFEKVSPKVFDALFGKGDEEGPAIKAVTAFAEAIALAGEVVGEFVDTLVATGVIDRKAKTPAEQKAIAEKQQAKAERALAKFDEETGGMYAPGSDQFGPMDPAKAAERKALLANIDSAKNSVKAAGDAMWTKPGEKVQDLTRGEFVRKYMELGQQGGDASDWKGAGAYDERVRKIAEKIESDPSYEVVGGFSKMDQGDANDAQKKLVADYQAQQRLAMAASESSALGDSRWGGYSNEAFGAQNTGQSRDERVQGAAASMAELVAGAKNAADVLAKLKSPSAQPTILGAPPS